MAIDPLIDPHEEERLQVVVLLEEVQLVEVVVHRIFDLEVMGELPWLLVEEVAEVVRASRSLPRMFVQMAI